MPETEVKAPTQVTVKYVGRDRWVARSDKFLENGDVFVTNERDAAALIARYRISKTKSAFEVVKDTKKKGKG